MKTGNQYYIGWDVGGWHCPKNSSTKSQDAIFILDANLEPVGAARAGNITDVILQSESTGDFIGGLFEYCSAARRNESMVTLAIDAPLGFPEDFLNLAAKLRVVGAIENFRKKDTSSDRPSGTSPTKAGNRCRQSRTALAARQARACM
jgi:hypothetical protein